MKHADIVARIKKQKDNKYNSIPVGFKRARKVVPGIVRGETVGITGNGKVGKTKFVIHHYIKNALEFVKAVNSESTLDIRIWIVSLQKSELAYRCMIISNLIFESHGVEIGYRDIMSVLQEEDRKVDNRILGYIEEQEEFWRFFDEKCVIITERNPVEIMKEVKAAARIRGATLTARDSGNRDYSYWGYHNENFFPVLIIDQITRVSNTVHPVTRASLDTRLSMQLMMEYVEELGNDYQFFTVVVHPQIPDKERVEMDFSGRTKEEKVQPSLDALAMNRQIGEYYTTVLGLFSPHPYRIKTHAKFLICENEQGGGNGFKDKYVSLIILASEDTRKNDRIGLWFEGGGGYFEELPRAEEFQGNDGRPDPDLCSDYMAETKARLYHQD